MENYWTNKKSVNIQHSKLGQCPFCMNYYSKRVIRLWPFMKACDALLGPSALLHCSFWYLLANQTQGHLFPLVECHLFLLCGQVAKSCWNMKLGSPKSYLLSRTFGVL